MDKKSSELGQVVALADTMRVLMYVPSETLPENQNKTAVLTLFDARYSRVAAPIISTSTSLSISTVAKYTYTGASTGTWTLPTGSADLLAKEIWITNDTAFNLTIQRASTDTILGGLTSVICYPQQTFIFYWNGTKWIYR